jgi:transposase
MGIHGKIYIKAVKITMDEIVRMLDENLEYISHEIKDETIYIYVSAKQEEAICPYCGQISEKVHSRYPRTFQDLPIQGKKVKIVLNNRKFFCKNADCSHKTFAEGFPFLARSATKTNRLQEEILNVSLNQSSVSAAQYLRKSCCTVGKSTICSLLKKR